MMETSQHDPAGSETYLVAPRSPGPDGIATLARLQARVQAIPGGHAESPRPVPGLARPTPRLLVSLPGPAAEALKAEFGGALSFDPEADLQY